MSERITCKHEIAGKTCGRFLGEIDQDRVMIYCPGCKAMHEMNIVDLVKHLEQYLDEVERRAGRSKRPMVGFA